MTATTIDLDRERMACIFALGGGELHEPNPKFPDEWDGQIAFWYDGPPDYAEELKDADRVKCSACKGRGSMADEECLDCEGHGHRDHEVRTALLNCLFGTPQPPPGWERIASFTSSGEASCWWCGDGTGNEQARKGCQLCEGDGYVFIGDGWAEVVFRRTEPSW